MPRRCLVSALAALSISGAFADEVKWPATAAQLGLMSASPAPADARVTLANWQYGPHNRWAFQNVRELLPTAVVSRGDRPVEVITESPRDLESITFASASGKQSVLGMLAASYTDGILVLHRGELVYERYFNGLSEERPHLLWSVSKSIAGMLAGVLVEEGVLDLERPVSSYVPELKNSGWADNSLRDVLDMQTTSEWIEDYDDPASSVRRQDASNGLLPLPRELADLPRGNYFYLPTIGRDPDRAGRFVYKSGDTDVAAWAMERATGMRFAELLSARLWARIGVQHDAYYTIDPSGSVLASGGLNATLRDIARVGQLMLDDGKVAGRQVVPAAWIRDLKSVRNQEAWNNGPHGTDGPGGYRSFWWHTGNPHAAFYAHGVHGQWIYVDPTAKVVIAKLSSHPEPSSRADDALSLAGFAAMIDALSTDD